MKNLKIKYFIVYNNLLHETFVGSERKITGFIISKFESFPMDMAPLVIPKRLSYLPPLVGRNVSWLSLKTP